eukprot:COSAG02_NODE_4421_length_5377_cov_4.815839_1_plen_291_part_00
MPPETPMQTPGTCPHTCTVTVPLTADEFPDETLALVCRFLHLKQLGRLACVARRFTELALTEPGSGARISAIEEGARLQIEAVMACGGAGGAGGAVAKRSGETWMRALWRTQYCLVFHDICGSNGQLFNDNASCRRTQSFAGAVCITKTPLPYVNGAFRFCVKIDEMGSTYAGALEVGFTTSNPDAGEVATFRYLSDKGKDHRWWVRGNAYMQNDLATGDLVEVALLPTGAFQIRINGQVCAGLELWERRREEEGRLAGSTPPSGSSGTAVFGVVGVFGKVCAVTLLHPK